MADTTNLSAFLGDVANAIREKKGTQEQIPAANFDTEIKSIETGIDTSSDNPIAANDVVEGKEGFANGNKIIGNVKPIIANEIMQDLSANTDNVLGSTDITAINLSNGITIPLNMIPEDIQNKNFIVRYYRRSYAPDRPYLQLVITNITNKFYLQYTSGNDYAIKSKTNTPFNYYYLDSYTSDSQITDWVKSENVTTASEFGASIDGYASLYDVYDNNQDTGNAIYSALNIQATSYLTMNIQNKADTMLRSNSNISLGSTYDKVAEVIGLTAEKIVKGNTILGIEGTMQPNSNTPNIYIQEAEPETKEGIWIKANKPLNKILTATIKMDAKWDIENIYPTLPVPINSNKAAFIDNYIYILGAYRANSNIVPETVYKYNIKSKEYTKLRNLPYTGINISDCVAIGTNIYFLGNSSLDTTTSSMWKYDTITDTYTEVGAASHPVTQSTLVAVGNDIYIFGGWGRDEIRSSAGKYNIISNTYTSLAKIPGKPYIVSGVTDNKYIYLFCKSYNSSFDKKSYKYDIAANSYTEITDISSAITDFNYTSEINPIIAGDKVYLFGYGNDYNYNKNAYVYDISTDSYTAIGDMFYRVYGAVSVKANNSIYILGGGTLADDPGYKNNYKNVQVLNLGGELPEGLVDGSIIIANGNTYSTELVSTDKIEGRVTSTFNDVIYYDNGTQDNNLPTYYGTGTEWTKFKN